MAPGVRSRIVSRTTRVKSSCPSAAAKPTTAMSAGRSVSVTWKASAREWLKPSAARKRDDRVDEQAPARRCA